MTRTHRFLASSLLGLTAVSAFAQSGGVIAIYPSPTTVDVGTSRQFSKYVTVSPSGVVWSVNDVVGGSSTYGTVDQNGLYKAPAVIPMANVVTVKATSTAQPSKFGSSAVTIKQPTPWVWGCSPLSFPVGPISLKVTGAGYVPASVVTLNGSPLTTTYVSATELRATGNATSAQVGSVQIRVVNPNPGGVTSEPKAVTVTQPPAAEVTVTISPTSATVILSTTRQFSATVKNTSNTAVTWSVNNMTGGNSSVGTISAAGLYTAPAALPSPATVTVHATSVAATTKSASATVTLQAPTPAGPAITSVSPTTMNVGSFALTVNGSGFVSTSVVKFGGTSLATSYVSATQLTAAGSAPTAGVVAVTVVNGSTASNAVNVTVNAPAAPPVNLSHARFLEQAGFGPTTADLAKVAQLGFAGWLNDQFATVETPITSPGGQNMAAVKSEYLARLANSPDQLRQKMIYALGNIIVVSSNKNIYPDEMVPYLQILSRNAFGNYRTLLKEITVSPQMGKYLDLANSNKPGVSSGANENYPRELMQLFTIGLYLLNPDGTPTTTPTYNQQTVQQVALALTGWTYPTAPGAQPRSNNWEYFVGDMEPRDGNHDKTAKSFLGCSLPANQTVQQDTDGVIDCLMAHPNIGPFVSLRLIRALVTSNPSGAYVQRVAQVFNDNGLGVKGDLKAVVQAILLDPEARQDNATPNQGRLKDPMYYFAAFARAMQGSISPANGMTYLFAEMSQAPTTAPSVFGFYSPLYRIPKTALFGPEFQIYSSTDSTVRGNLIYQLLGQPGNTDMPINLSPFLAVANNTSQLIDLVDQTLLYGRMPAGMRASLTAAVNASYDANQKVVTALYLTALSGQYAVQY